MALKRLKVKATEKKPNSDKEIPEVLIEGNVIKRYNRASDAYKAAEARMKDLKPEILEVGCGEVFERTIADPLHPVLTVKLVDDTGEAVRVQYTKRYSAIPEAALEDVEGLFSDHNVDINTQLKETVVPAFNPSAFEDAKGNFDQKRYDAYTKAVAKVAEQFGDETPLTTAKVFAAKDCFHAERFVHFETVDAQWRIDKLVKNVTQVVPVRTKN
jgi:hypothetical protein